MKKASKTVNKEDDVDSQRKKKEDTKQNKVN